MSYYKGLSFSFNIASRGLFSRKVDQDLVKDSIKQILLTGRGSRVMRRDFGASIGRVLFDNLGVFTESVIRDLVSSAIRLYEPRVTVNNISVDSKDEPPTLDVLIEYTFEGKPDVAKISTGV